jgi:hypothetical protein
MALDAVVALGAAVSLGAAGSSGVLSFDTGPSPVGCSSLDRALDRALPLSLVFGTDVAGLIGRGGAPFGRFDAGTAKLSRLLALTVAVDGVATGERERER